MRPIKLKIKGLNSFIEEQEIDFNTLTDRGLFGIFGPTGSGKSTILDGITLALYGKVARKSSNYINTNCDSANVSFEFQISGGEVKRYVVSREIKVDKKKGSIKTSKCKIVDVTDRENEIVLADNKTRVDAKCEEIIGLNLDDFTRTVVLPQGKFSEFLKLEGKSRREMLERLFNLEKYGDLLGRKLGREINKEKTENSTLLGELKGYEDINEDNLKIKEEELEETSKNLKELIKEEEALKKKYESLKEVWNLQEELKDYKEREEKLNEERTSIESLAYKVSLGEKAIRVIPYLKAYESTLIEIENSLKEEEVLSLKVKKLEGEKESIDSLWEKERKKADIELPKLKIKENNIEDALKEEEIIFTLNNEVNLLIKDIKEIEHSIKNKEFTIKKIEEYITSINEKVKKEEGDFDNLNIDPKLKEQVLRGVEIVNEYNMILRASKEDEKSINDLKSKINEKVKERKELLNLWKEKTNLYKKKDGELQKLIEYSPGNEETLANLQKELSESKNKWDRYNEITKSIEEKNISIKELEEELKRDKDKKVTLEEEKDRLNNKLKELNIEDLSNKLREELVSGEVCPLCGSKEHHLENLKGSSKDLKNIIKELEEEIKHKEKSLKEIEGKIASNTGKVDFTNKAIKDLDRQVKGLGEDFKNKNSNILEEEFNKLKKSIEEYKNKKEALEKENNKLKDEVIKIEEKGKGILSVIDDNKDRVGKLEESFNNKALELKKLKEEGLALKDKSGVLDFINRNKEIIVSEKKREEIRKSLKINRDNLEKKRIEKESLREEWNREREDLAKDKTTLKEKKENIEEKKKYIKSKVKEEGDLKELLKEVVLEIKKIEEDFKTLNNKKEEIYKNYKISSDKFIEVKSKLNELNIRKESSYKELNSEMKEDGFSSKEEVLENYLDREKIESFKNKIEIFNSEDSKIKGAIGSILKKLNNRELSKELWEEIKKEKEEWKEKVEKGKEEYIKISEEVKIIKKKLLDLKELLDKKEKLEHKLALLSDLDYLFRGKKFVEFVAITRLKYISIEASKRLKDITNGNYGLEVDEDGRFIIRDYKNGGAKRDASTLSGGETFVASLALALALSSEIQLKGTAPLELFFLDEGFGTLDENLLDVVMESLERLHNNKLKVGIISHVEGIKNRVPVKLIVTPAESGRGGSKVKIERS